MFNIIKTETEGVETRDQATHLPAQDNDWSAIIKMLAQFSIPSHNKASIKPDNYQTIMYFIYYCHQHWAKGLNNLASSPLLGPIYVILLTHSLSL